MTASISYPGPHRSACKCYSQWCPAGLLLTTCTCECFALHWQNMLQWYTYTAYASCRSADCHLYQLHGGYDEVWWSIYLNPLLLPTHAVPEHHSRWQLLLTSFKHLVIVVMPSKCVQVVRVCVWELREVVVLMHMILCMLLSVWLSHIPQHWSFACNDTCLQQ
jgi:hypothetical protein